MYLLTIVIHTDNTVYEDENSIIDFKQYETYSKIDIKMRHANLLS